MRCFNTAFWALLVILSTLFPAQAKAGSTYSDLATWQALASTTSSEDFEAYASTDSPSGSYTGFTATALTGSGFAYVDFTGDMSLCDGDGGVAPEIEFTLDVPSTLFGLTPQSLDYPHDICGYYAGSLVECIAITSDATFTGYEFASLVDTVVFDATVTDSICAGTVYTEADNDGDGYTTTGEDCNDSDPLAYPGVSEVPYDGSDNDCDSSTLDDDLDEDGYTYSDDCDDLDASVYVNQMWCEDADLDGYSSTTCVTDCHSPGDTWSNSNPTTDCDDSDAAISPSGTETCNGYDDNCDSVIDDANASGCASFYEDVDGDGYGSSTSACLCAAEESYTASYDGDCDDTDADYNPGAAESCDEDVDYNCDGSTGYANADEDAYAACEECDDSDPAIYPGATEVCNGYDDDCDDSVDEAGAEGEQTWCEDADLDGYSSTTCVTQCDSPGFDWSASNPTTDCDDLDATVYPGAAEVLDDGVDQDCDGSDATTPIDTGIVDDTGSDTGEVERITVDDGAITIKSGCGCQVTRFNWDHSVASLLLILLLGAVVGRRRRDG